MKTEKPPAVAKADKLASPKKVERRRGQTVQGRLLGNRA